MYLLKYKFTHERVFLFCNENYISNNLVVFYILTEKFMTEKDIECKYNICIIGWGEQIFYIIAQVDLLLIISVI